MYFWYYSYSIHIMTEKQCHIQIGGFISCNTIVLIDITVIKNSWFYGFLLLCIMLYSRLHCLPKYSQSKVQQACQTTHLILQRHILRELCESSQFLVETKMPSFSLWPLTLQRGINWIRFVVLAKGIGCVLFCFVLFLHPVRDSSVFLSETVFCLL